MARFKCRDSACLLRSAEGLSPLCAGFLLSEPEPSPSPEVPPVVAQMIAPRPVPLARSASPVGFFSVTTSDGDGHVREVHSEVDLSARGASLLPPGLEELLPIPMLSILGQAMPMPSAAADEHPRVAVAPSSSSSGPMAMMMSLLRAAEEDADLELVVDAAPRPAPPQHPCAAYIPACAREAHSNARADIEACLVRHLDQLSSECKCFVHHTVPAAAQPQQAAAADAQSSPTVAVVAESGAADSGAATEGDEMRHAHPLHRLSCLFVFSAVFLTTMMLVRACVLACVGKGGAAPRRVIVVPPEAPAPIKAVPSKAIQIAEPLR